jgi:hypothetical protein
MFNCSYSPRSVHRPAWRIFYIYSSLLEKFSVLNIVQDMILRLIYGRFDDNWNTLVVPSSCSLVLLMSQVQGLYMPAPLTLRVKAFLDSPLLRLAVFANLNLMKRTVLVVRYIVLLSLVYDLAWTSRRPPSGTSIHTVILQGVDV